jgi:hypothetical protein
VDHLYVLLEVVTTIQVDVCVAANHFLLQLAVMMAAVCQLLCRNNEVLEVVLLDRKSVV